MCRLKTYIPAYEKGAEEIFATTRNSLGLATQRAQALATKFTADTSPEPYTAIAEIVKLLTTLRS